MRIKKARQILKSLADDTRLRIINLLNKQQLNVTELCAVLDVGQSNLSKHLARLRLTGVVADKRKGVNIYYYLHRPEHKAHKELITAITGGLAELKTFKEDVQRLKDFQREKNNGKKK